MVLGAMLRTQTKRGMPHGAFQGGTVLYSAGQRSAVLSRAGQRSAAQGFAEVKALRFTV